MSAPAVKNQEEATYYNPRYLGTNFQRLASYRRQLIFAAKGSDQSFLVVGKGDGFTVDVLRNIGKTVTVLDVNPNLGPDIVGSVDDIPLGNDAYDVSICCQVLEHLPFERFPVALKELARVSRKRLILSVPDIRRLFSISVRIGSRTFERQCTLPRFRKMPIPAERFDQHGHHWEMGYDGFPFNRVASEIQKSGWRILETYRVPELAWHTFFHLEKISA